MSVNLVLQMRCSILLPSFDGKEIRNSIFYICRGCGMAVLKVIFGVYDNEWLMDSPIVMLLVILGRSGKEEYP